MVHHWHSYLQADVSVAALQHGDDVAVRQTVHGLTVNTDDPVAHLNTQTRLLYSLTVVTRCDAGTAGAAPFVTV